MSTPAPPQPPPSSAESIGCSDDLLSEILTYLPVKSLFRFKSVNKQFLTLISDNSFSLLHSLRHRNPPPSALFLLLHHPLEFSPIVPAFSFIPLSPSSLSLPPPPLPPHLLQSCNGLFLSYYDSAVVVSNPTTRLNARISIGQLGQGIGQCWGHGQDAADEGQLGQQNGQEDGPCEQVGQWNGQDGVDDGQLGQGQEGQRELVGVNLAYDPGRWAHYYIVKVIKLGENCFQIGVYGSDIGTWKDNDGALEDVPFDVEFDRGVYWGGKVFWLSHTGSTVYYDVEKGCFGRLVLPKVFDEGTYLERFRYFGESCGHLHLIEIRTNCVREFDVLELVDNEGGDSAKLEWVVKYKVDLDDVGFGFEDDMFQDGVDRFGRRLRFYAFSILAVVCGNDDDYDDEDGSALVLSIPGKVISYSFKSKVSRLMCNVVDESDKWFPFRGYNAFQFIQSLYRP